MLIQDLLKKIKKLQKKVEKLKKQTAIGKFAKNIKDKKKIINKKKTDLRTKILNKSVFGQKVLEAQEKRNEFLKKKAKIKKNIKNRALEKMGLLDPDRKLGKRAKQQKYWDENPQEYAEHLNKKRLERNAKQRAYRQRKRDELAEQKLKIEVIKDRYIKVQTEIAKDLMENGDVEAYEEFENSTVYYGEINFQSDMVSYKEFTQEGGYYQYLLNMIEFYEDVNVKVESLLAEANIPEEYAKAYLEEYRTEINKKEASLGFEGEIKNG